MLRKFLPLALALAACAQDSGDAEDSGSGPDAVDPCYYSPDECSKQVAPPSPVQLGSGGTIQEAATATGCSNVSKDPGDYNSPIILDIDGNGYALTDSAHGVAFDINADGTKPTISWTSAGAGDMFLALDWNGNGVIDDGSELFGSSTAQVGTGSTPTPNGFLALSMFDSNHDGKLTSADTIWSSLRLWQDANHNGISEAAELHPLSDFWITAISTQIVASPGSWYDNKGNNYRYAAVLTHAYNSPYPTNGYAWDIYFTDRLPVGKAAPPKTPIVVLCGGSGGGGAGGSGGSGGGSTGSFWRIGDFWTNGFGPFVTMTCQDTIFWKPKTAGFPPGTPVNDICSGYRLPYPPFNVDPAGTSFPIISGFFSYGSILGPANADTSADEYKNFIENIPIPPWWRAKIVTDMIAWWYSFTIPNGSQFAKYGGLYNYCDMVDPRSGAVTITYHLSSWKFPSSPITAGIPAVIVDGCVFTSGSSFSDAQNNANKFWLTAEPDWGAN